LSLVYLDLLNMTPKPELGWAARGEALCRESLRLAEKPAHRATAWYNLGGWRQRADDFENAASAFLEAANLYEQLNNELLFAYSLAYRAQCLLEAGDFFQARLDSVRAVTLLLKQPKASKALIVQTYQAAERSMAKFTTETPE
jgi:tetratricopeptide (TPR) repeat protein